jgi:hypothetical protein
MDEMRRSVVWCGVVIGSLVADGCYDLWDYSACNRVCYRLGVSYKLTSLSSIRSGF